MAMELSPTNLIQFFGTLSPIMVSFFLLSASILNKNIKGLIYMAGVMFAFVLNAVFMNVLKVPLDEGRSLACNLIEMPFSINAYSSPSWNSVFIAFTLAYMYLPMSFSGNMNYGVIVALLALFGLDAATKVMNKCTNNLGVVIGGLLGLVLGGAWYGIIKASGNPQLLYFEELSNGETCSRPSKQTFKCAVYKNGKLIKNL
jgi:hypothetical protein